MEIIKQLIEIHQCADTHQKYHDQSDNATFYSYARKYSAVRVFAPEKNNQGENQTICEGSQENRVIKSE